MATRLTSQELDRAIDKIRAEYDHYIVHFHKTAEAKRRFEERYGQALRDRANLTTFVGAEMQAVKTLVEQARVEAENPPPDVPVKRVISYADHVLAQMKAKIQGYPLLGLPHHPEKSEDVDRLYGTLRWFRKEIWEVLYPIILAKAPSPALFVADTDLGALTLQGDRWPKEVELYVAMLKGQPDLSQVARAQNRCLLQAGQFLFRVKQVFEAAAQEKALTDADRSSLARAQSFCDRVLSDFRLKELVSRG